MVREGGWFWRVFPQDSRFLCVLSGEGAELAEADDVVYKIDEANRGGDSVHVDIFQMKSAQRVFDKPKHMLHATAYLGLLPVFAPLLICQRYMTGAFYLDEGFDAEILQMSANQGGLIGGVRVHFPVVFINQDGKHFAVVGGGGCDHVIDDHF